MSHHGTADSPRPRAAQSHQSHNERQQVNAEQLLLRPTEAAAALGIGRTLVYALMRSGALPTVHIGRAVRIPRQDLLAFIQHQRAVSSALSSASERSASTCSG